MFITNGVYGDLYFVAAKSGEGGGRKANAKACVYGVPNELLGEVVKAVIVMRDDADRQGVVREERACACILLFKTFPHGEIYWT
mgnify:CR=1 FL=1